MRTLSIPTIILLGIQIVELAMIHRFVGLEW